MKRLLILCPLCLFLIAGCASNIQSLQRESARYIGNSFKPTDIQVTEVKRGLMNVGWKATTPNGDTYDCSADDMLRRVNCVK